MRQKIYRVWAGGKMHFPAIITFDAKGAVFSPADSGGGSWRAELENVCEPTGLRDKKGRDVYEGDVVRFDTTPDYARIHGLLTGEVMWDDGDASFYYATHTDDYPHVKPWYAKDLLVIGNVHEHPGLLK